MRIAAPFSVKPTLLAVDDTPSNLIALEAVLDRDFDLVFAGSGTEAIHILEKRQDFSVILMDVQMPEMDGFEAVERIKHIPGCADIPIVFITAVYRDDPYARRGYEVGGVDYFTKPFDPELLRMKVGIYASFRQRGAVLKERERQLRETEELLRAGRKLSTVIEALPVGVLIADVEGRIFQANEEVARISKSIDLIDHDAYGAVLRWWDSSGQMLRDQQGPLARALLGEPSQNELVQIRCLDATIKSVLVSASPLRGLVGEIVGAVIVIQDVTEPKRIQQELEERIARLVSVGFELEHTTLH